VGEGVSDILFENHTDVFIEFKKYLKQYFG